MAHLVDIRKTTESGEPAEMPGRLFRGFGDDRQAEPVSDTLAIYAVERQHIEKVLKIFKGNRKKTAEALNISEKGLYLKIKEYGIVVG